MCYCAYSVCLLSFFPRLPSTSPYRPPTRLVFLTLPRLAQVFTSASQCWGSELPSQCSQQQMEEATRAYAAQRPEFNLLSNNCARFACSMLSLCGGATSSEAAVSLLSNSSAAAAVPPTCQPEVCADHLMFEGPKGALRLAPPPPIICPQHVSPAAPLPTRTPRPLPLNFQPSTHTPHTSLQASLAAACTRSPPIWPTTWRSAARSLVQRPPRLCLGTRRNLRRNLRRSWLCRWLSKAVRGYSCPWGSCEIEVKCPPG